MYVCMHVCMQVCMYVYTYVDMYIPMYMYKGPNLLMSEECRSAPVPQQIAMELESGTSKLCQ